MRHRSRCICSRSDLTYRKLKVTHGYTGCPFFAADGDTVSTVFPLTYSHDVLLATQPDKQVLDGSVDFEKMSEKLVVEGCAMKMLCHTSSRLARSREEIGVGCPFCKIIPLHEATPLLSETD